jgi:hypothetical protein
MKVTLDEESIRYEAITTPEPTVTLNPGQYIFRDKSRHWVEIVTEETSFPWHDGMVSIHRI